MEIPEVTSTDDDEADDRHPETCHRRGSECCCRKKNVTDRHTRKNLHGDRTTQHAARNQTTGNAGLLEESSCKWIHGEDDNEYIDTTDGHQQGCDVNGCNGAGRSEFFKYRVRYAHRKTGVLQHLSEHLTTEENREQEHNHVRHARHIGHFIGREGADATGDSHDQCCHRRQQNQ